MNPILVATSHGTDNVAGRVAIRTLVDALRSRLGDVEVVDAFVDVESPRVGEVVAGATGPCVVVPLLLSPGYHVHHQIADAVALGAQHRAAATMGPDHRLAEIMVDRLKEAGADAGDAVIVVAAGSTEAGARAATERLVPLVAKAWGGPVALGHLGGTGTPLSAVIAQRQAAGRRIALASYLLADGHFQDMVVAADADIKARPLLNGGEPDARLVDLLIERYVESR